MDWPQIEAAATTLGVGVAAISAVLALATYRNQVKSAADAHMHGVFRQYLAERLHACDPQALETLKLYVLEEMVDWVREQQHALRRLPFRLFSGRRRAHELKQWEATILSHLGDPCEMQARIESANATESYGDEFRAFVREACAAERAAQLGHRT